MASEGHGETQLLSRHTTWHAGDHGTDPNAQAVSPNLSFLHAVRAVQKLKKKAASKETGTRYGSTSERSTLQDSVPEVPEEEEEDAPFYKDETQMEALYDIFFGRWLSLLLLVMPFALAADFLDWSDAWVFWLNFFVMIPLASTLGEFTEELAEHTNQTIGGLVNATFGNAVEAVVAIQALIAGEIRVVQSSMLGSIFSNLLLVLGCCFFFGGLKYKEQYFNSTSAMSSIGVLALGGIAFVLPTPFAAYYDLAESDALLVSRIAALFLFFMYFQLLYFQLFSHIHLYNEGEQNESVEEGDGESGDEVEESGARISWHVALSGLLFTTTLVTFFSNYLVASITGYVDSTDYMTETFVGIILLPIIGNAVEHIAAVSVALKNKMDLSMGVCVGSCTQIMLFVLPLTVLVGWCLGIDMTLNYPRFEIILFILSVITVSILASNGKSNWLEGSILITTYLLIACGFFYEHVVDY